jgi:2-dehydro-3-deoxygalactonokinase
MTPVAGTLLLLDVGSTNTRAWLVVGGTVIERRTAPVGVRDTATSGSDALLRHSLAALVAELSVVRAPTGIGAAGMITSAQGLREVPHVLAPASMTDLARQAVLHRDPAIAALPILLVPGVRTTGVAADLSADVMRGEETLVVGLLATGRLVAGECLLNAGSHWKLIETDSASRIVRSRTSLGGELMHAVQAHTLLSASLPQQTLTSPDLRALEAGARAARTQGLLRALFGIRLLDQGAELSAASRLSWLAGACIAEDLRGLEQSGWLHQSTPIAVAGPGAIPEAWSHLLAAAGADARPLPATAIEESFVAGLLAIVAEVE